MSRVLGLELHGNDAIAVAVDELGSVLGRAHVSDRDSVGAAAASALATVVAAVAMPLAGLGVAAIARDAAPVKAALDELAKRYAGPFLREGAVASGTAAAVGEAWVGAAKDARDVVFLSVDEHVTAGIVRDGAPFAGAHGRAAAAAWLALNPVEREDYRKMGCLEAEASAAGIVRRLVWRIKAGDRSRIENEVKGDLSAITVAHALDAARNGDGVAISVVRDTAKYLGMAAANLVVVVDPAVLVLGGIVAGSPDVLLELVRTELARRLPRATLDTLMIAPAKLGAEAAAIGAARLATAALQ